MTKAIFYNRDFTDRLPLPAGARATVERYENNMIGGPKTAIVRILRTADRWDYRKLLRCPVKIQGADGKLKWWGMVNSVIIPQGDQRFGYSLDSMFNYIQIRYGQDSLTEAASDAVSIAEYGQKELITRSYDLTGLEAAQLRGVQLAKKSQPQKEIEFTGGDNDVIIECIGWHDTFRWKNYTNTTESNVSNTTQISTIATATGQFIQGVLIENAAGVVSNQARDARDGLSCINELLQAGTSNNRPLLAKIDEERYFHVYEQSAEPPAGGEPDYIMRSDSRLGYSSTNDS